MRYMKISLLIVFFGVVVSVGFIFADEPYSLGIYIHCWKYFDAFQYTITEYTVELVKDESGISVNTTKGSSNTFVATKGDFYVYTQKHGVDYIEVVIIEPSADPIELTFNPLEYSNDPTVKIEGYQRLSAEYWFANDY